VIDYRLEGIEGSEPIYPLATTILDPNKAPAGELAALYHRRWEIETAFDELKTHLRGGQIVLLPPQRHGPVAGDPGFHPSDMDPSLGTPAQ
jgi:hypothetical protein